MKWNKCFYEKIDRETEKKGAINIRKTGDAIPYLILKNVFDR